MYVVDVLGFQTLGGPLFLFCVCSQERERHLGVGCVFKTKMQNFLFFISIIISICEIISIKS